MNIKLVLRKIVWILLLPFKIILWPFFYYIIFLSDFFDWLNDDESTWKEARYVWNTITKINFWK